MGLVILTLMENLPVEYEKPGQVPSHGFTCTGTYLHDLEELANQCVRLDPHQRVKFWGLQRWERVYGAMGGKRVDDLPSFAKAQVIWSEPVIDEFMGDE